LNVLNHVVLQFADTVRETVSDRQTDLTVKRQLDKVWR